MSLAELATFRGSLGLRVERDRHFVARQIRSGLRRRSPASQPHRQLTRRPSAAGARRRPFSTGRRMHPRTTTESIPAKHTWRLRRRARWRASAQFLLVRKEEGLPVLIIVPHRRTGLVWSLALPGPPAADRMAHRRHSSPSRRSVVHPLHSFLGTRQSGSALRLPRSSRQPGLLRCGVGAPLHGQSRPESGDDDHEHDLFIGPTSTPSTASAKPRSTRSSPARGTRSRSGCARALR